MTLEEIRPFVRQGKWGRIPKWIGYVKYDPATQNLYFENNGYILTEQELKDKIKDRNDIYYII